MGSTAIKKLPPNMPGTELEEVESTQRDQLPRSTILRKDATCQTLKLSRSKIAMARSQLIYFTQTSLLSSSMPSETGSTLLHPLLLKLNYEKLTLNQIEYRNFMHIYAQKKELKK